MDTDTDTDTDTDLALGQRSCLFLKACLDNVRATAVPCRGRGAETRCEARGREGWRKKRGKSRVFEVEGGREREVEWRERERERERDGDADERAAGWRERKGREERTETGEQVGGQCQCPNLASALGCMLHVVCEYEQ